MSVRVSLNEKTTVIVDIENPLVGIPDGLARMRSSKVGESTVNVPVRIEGDVTDVKRLGRGSLANMINEQLAQEEYELVVGDLSLAD